MRKRPTFSTPRYKPVGRHAPAEERFWRKVDVSDCWWWTAGTSDTGYGSFGGTNAHTWAWTHLVGPVPEGMELDHRCRNRLCVNPDHLEVVTPAENLSRSMHPTAISVRTNRCWRGHEFTPENTRWNNAAKTKRTCRECGLARSRGRTSVTGVVA